MNEGQLTSRMRAAASDEDPAEEARRQGLLRARLFGPTEPIEIGRFKLTERVGAGAMGTVYLAHDDQLDRPVAIKVLRGDTTPDAAERLLREARALARLTHPNVVTVYEIGAVGDQWYVAMEYVRGQNLADWQVGKTVWQALLPPYLEAGKGLAAVHAADLVHRDFKASNVLIGDDGRVRVADFGLVRSERSSEVECDPGMDTGDLEVQITLAGRVVGTPAYMAPEQLLGNKATHRSDQFSFCVALYEAIYGERPFRGKTEHALFHAIREGVKFDLEGAPVWLAAALERGLSLRPEDRFESMGALLTALQPPSPSPPTRRLQPAAVGLALLASVLVFALLPPRQPEPKDTSADRALEVVHKDPTRAAEILLASEATSERWSSAARRTLSAPISERLLSIPTEPLRSMGWCADGTFVARLKDQPRFEWVTPDERAVLTPQRAWLCNANFQDRRVVSSPEALQRLKDAGQRFGPIEAWAQHPDGRIRLATKTELIEGPNGPQPTRIPLAGNTHLRFLDGDAGYLVRSPRGRFIQIAMTGAMTEIPIETPLRRYTVGAKTVGFLRRDNQVMIWNGEALQRLGTLDEDIVNLRISPDDRWVLAFSRRVVKAWRREGVPLERELPGRWRQVIFTGSDQAVLLGLASSGKLWNLAQHRFTSLDGHAREVNLGALGPRVRGSRTLATASTDGTARVWNLTGVHGRGLMAHAKKIWSGSVDAEGRTIATAGHDGVVRLFDLTGEAPPRALVGHEAPATYHTAFSPDGTRLVSGGADGTARVWSLDTPERAPLVLRGHDAWAYAVAFSPGNEAVATSDRDGTVRLLRLEDGESKVLGRHARTYEQQDSRVHTLAFAQDGRSVLSASRNGSVMMWRLDGRPHRELLRRGQDPTIYRTKDGSIYTLTDDGVVERWTVEGVPDLRRATETVASTRFAVSDDEAWIAIATTERQVHFMPLDPEHGGTRTMTGLGVCEALAFDPSAPRLAIGDNDGQIRVVSLENGEVLWRFSGHTAAVRFLHFFEGDLVSASFDGTVRRWETRGDPPTLRARLLERTGAP